MGDKVLGYGEEKDKDLLKSINGTLKSFSQLFSGVVKDLIVNRYFSKYKDKEFLYNEVQNFSLKTFGKNLTRKDIIFAIFKNDINGIGKGQCKKRIENTKSRPINSSSKL